MVDGLSVYDQDVRVEVCVPDEDGEEHDTIEKAGADNGAIFQVLPRQELNRRDLCLVVDEDWEQQNTEDNHRDDVAGLPAIGGVCLEGKR